jgi:hypothetical protein
VATNNYGSTYSQALGGTDLSRGLQQVVSDLASQIGEVAAGSSTNANGATATQIEQLRTVNQSQADAITANTVALLANTAAKSTSSSGSTLSTVGSIASQVLGGGLGLVSLVSGLAKLFGGGDSSTTTTLVSYTRPDAVNFEGQVSRSTNGTDWTATQGSQAGTPTAASAQQITVQVNAMDSKSFLDHSNDIARAVRAAMLNSHSLNDVVNDL